MIRTFASDAKKAQGVTSDGTEAVATPESNDSVKPIGETTITPESPKKQAVSLNELRAHVDMANHSAADFLSDITPNDKPTTKETPAEEKVNIPSSSIKKELEQISTLSGTEILGDEETYDVDSGEGTIIQDRKIERHHLLPSMFKATQKWAEQTKGEIEESQKPKFTVAKPETRAETIRAAAAHSKLVPGADYGTALEKFKKTEHEIEQPTVVIKDKTEVPKPTWSYTIDEETKESATEDTIATEENLPAQITETEPIPSREPEPKIVPVVAAVETTAEPMVTTEPMIPELAKEPLPAETTAESELPIKQKRPSKAGLALSRQISNIGNFINKIPIYAIVVFFIVLSLIGISSSLLVFLKPNQQTTTTTSIDTQVERLAAGEYDVPFSNNPRELLISIDANQTVGNEISIVTFRNQADQVVPSLNAAQTIISSTDAPLLSRSLKEATFGYTKNGSPFIILITSGYDTGFAGMLAWEKSMSSNLAPLFGQTNTSNFIDSDYSGPNIRSARTLYSKDNNLQIIYTVNDNGVIVVATNQAVLSEVDKLIK